jgi:catechol 2,3-dioxygenase-like lactoylglutathione lyase family enzyme
MIEFVTVDHFHICVPEERLEEAKEFYTGVMGLKLIYRPDHLFSGAGYWFDIGNKQLHIGVEPALPQSIRHTAMQVADIAQARAHLIKNGIKITEEAPIPGRMRFAFTDPFGNRMELLQLID